jgi:hypothetical protein
MNLEKVFEAFEEKNSGKICERKIFFGEKSRSSHKIDR